MNKKHPLIISIVFLSLFNFSFGQEPDINTVYIDNNNLTVNVGTNSSKTVDLQVESLDDWIYLDLNIDIRNVSIISDVAGNNGVWVSITFDEFQANDHLRYQDYLLDGQLGFQQYYGDIDDDGTWDLDRQVAEFDLKHNNNWSSTENKSIKVRFKPEQYGPFVIYYRAASKYEGTVYKDVDTYDSPYDDAFGQPANRIILNITEPSGDLELTMRNINGTSQPLPGSDGDVRLYQDNSLVDSDDTNTSGIAKFSDLELGSYEARFFHDANLPTPHGDEYWGKKNVAVAAGENDEVFTRYMPYTPEGIKVYANGIDVSGTTVEPNTELTVVVKVQNDGAALQGRSRLILDRDKSGGFDYDDTSNSQSLGSLGNVTEFSFTYTPSNTGTYYYTINSQALLSGSYVVTDSWDWSQQPLFTVENPDPLPTVVNHSPTNGSTGISVTAPIVAHFDMDMDKATVENPNNFKVYDGVKYISISSIDYDADNRSATLYSTNNLFYSKDYTVTLSRFITDTNGNNLDGNSNGISENSTIDDFTFSFTTESWSNTEPLVSIVPEDNSSINGRQPLILVHGWKPYPSPGSPGEYIWDNFVQFTESGDDQTGVALDLISELNSTYKIYRVKYWSNLISVEEIGEKLRIALDNEFSGINNITLMAHSMGGLVSRAFMNYARPSGPYLGQKGGERVTSLITLGSPHHGSPVANGSIRHEIEHHNSNFQNWWYLQVIEKIDNELYKLDGPLFNEFSRKDLWWDNFYNGDSENYYYLIRSDGFEEENVWLKNLNTNESFASKIITYSGSYSEDNSNTEDDTAKAYKWGNKYMKNSLNKENDGVVPIESAQFYGNTTLDNRQFDQYNHDQIVKGKKIGEDNKYDNLFLWISNDLLHYNSKFLDISPDDEISFGDTVVNELVHDTIVLSNQSNQLINISNLELSGSNAQDFDIISPSNYNFDINIDESQEIVIGFTPSSEGQKTAQLIIGSDALNATPSHTIELIGQGLTNPIKEVIVDPSDQLVYFENVAVNQDEIKIISITNTGTEKLLISDMQLTGVDASMFEILLPESVSFPLAKGETENIFIQFTPTSEGTKEATLIMSNDSDNLPNIEIELFGGTIDHDIDDDGFTNDVDCDDNDNTVYPGAPEICDNKDNDCNGQIDDGIDEDNDGVCDANDLCPGTPNGTPVNPITGCPISTGSQIGVSTDTSNFGDVSLNTTEEITITISNTGTTSLNLSGFNITGTDSSLFALVNPTPQVLASGTSLDITVQFTPTTVGTKQAVLEIENDSENASPIKTIDLSGNGIGVPTGLTYVPDDNFEAYLETHDANGNVAPIGDPTSMGDGIDGNNYVLTVNISSVENLDVSFNNISDLTGIGDFTNLKSLNCSVNNLDELIVSNNLLLETLSCSHNNFTSLNFDNNLELIFVHCHVNQLTELSLTNNVKLISLICNNNNISDLDLSGNTSLRELYCYNNQITNLSFTNNIILRLARLESNLIESLDLSSLTNLQVINCSNNELNSLNLKNGLNENIVSHDFINNPNLSCIQVDDATWSTINWTNIDTHSSFSENCDSQETTSIPDSNFEQALIDLNIDTDGAINGQVFTNDINDEVSLELINKSISDLTGIQDFTSLVNLNARENILDSINVTSNINLEYLNVSYNNLSELDISQNINLSALSASNNAFSVLDISSNILLSVIDVTHNNFETLDYSSNTDLQEVRVSYNPTLQSFNLENGNNTSITTFYALEVPNLTCIQVDDATWSNTNWTNIGVNTNFSEDCLNSSITLIPDANFEQALIDLNIDTDGTINGQVLTSDISSITTLNVSNKNINDLTGIEDFTNLEVLLCNANNLSTLDVYNNLALTELNCGENNLSSLNVDSNANLTTLRCFYNNLSSLNLANNSALSWLSCFVNNLSSLNIKNGNNININGFDATDNAELECIQVDDATWSTTNLINIDVQTSFNEDCSATNSTYFTTEFFNLDDNLVPNSWDFQAIRSADITNGRINAYTNDGSARLSKQASILESAEEIVLEMDVAIDYSYWGLIYDFTLYSGDKYLYFRTGEEDYDYPANTLGNEISYYDGSSSQLLLETLSPSIVGTYHLRLIMNKEGYTFIGIDPNGDESFKIHLDDTNYFDFKTIDKIKYSVTAHTNNNGWMDNISISVNEDDWTLYIPDSSMHDLLVNYVDIIDTSGDGEISFNEAAAFTGALDLSNQGITDITGLQAFTNISELNLSGNNITDLSVLFGNDGVTLTNKSNKFKTVTSNTFSGLTTLNVSNNSIVSLDVSSLTELISLDCSNNLLNTLNVKNGNNLNFTVFNATGNSDLYCIQVNEVSHAESTWTNIDSQSNFSDTNCNAALVSKVFFQGPYNSTTGLMDDTLRSNGLIPLISPYTDAILVNQTVLDVTGADAIIDWVWVELRDSSDGLTVLDSRSAVLQADGDLVDTDGVSQLTFQDLPVGMYYVMVSHRNHLGALSASVINLSGIIMNIDLTTDSNLISGGVNGVKVMANNKLALYAGDFNGDGQIQNTDKNAVEPLRGVSGYNNADIDMNGEVQNTDLNSVLNPNIGKGQQFMSKKLHAKRKK